MIDDHRSSSSEDDFDGKHYHYTPTPTAHHEAETKQYESEEMYSSVRKGHETERGLLATDTMRTDRSGNVEISGQSLREPDLSRLESQSSGRLSLRVRPSKFN